MAYWCCIALAASLPDRPDLFYSLSCTQRGRLIVSLLERKLHFIALAVAPRCKGAVGEVTPGHGNFCRLTVAAAAGVSLPLTAAAAAAARGGKNTCCLSYFMEMKTFQAMQTGNTDICSVLQNSAIAHVSLDVLQSGLFEGNKSPL